MAAIPSSEQGANMKAAARPVEFEIFGGKDPEARVRVNDDGKEAILRLKVVVAAINRAGNDPNNGFPIYQINSQVVVGVLKSDPELKRPSVFRGPQEPTKGFA